MSQRTGGYITSYIDHTRFINAFVILALVDLQNLYQAVNHEPHTAVTSHTEGGGRIQLCHEHPNYKLEYLHSS